MPITRRRFYHSLIHVYRSLLFFFFFLGCVWIINVMMIHDTTRMLPQFLPNASRIRPSRVCAPLATILVNSAPRHAHRRQVIRETWGHPAITKQLGLTVAFGVGSDPTFHRPVDWEAETFGDIYQLPLNDEYKFLPQKILMFLQMASSTCEPVYFHVKTDDDVFVNVYALKELLEDLKDKSHENNFWCLVWEGMPVIRSNHSKWYLSEEKYGESIYPNYCSGSAYIINSVVLDAILGLSNNTNPFVPSEDVYITGFLANKAGIGHAQISHRYAFASISEERIASGQTIFAHLGPNAEERVEQIWTYLMKKRKKAYHPDYPDYYIWSQLVGINGV